MPETTKASGSAFHAPSGWAPLILTAAALALMAGYLLTGPHQPDVVIENGVARKDEGTVARLWQLMMLAQLVAIAVFLVRWLPRAPRQAAAMLTLQGIGLIAAALPVWLLEH